MAINTSTSPYYDDYDKDKKFHRILYRPGYAVQARELTQQQTILQNQIEQFGSHIFKNGSMVIPGQVTYDPDYYYVEIESQDPSDFQDRIVYNSTGVRAEVVNVAAAVDGDPDTLFVKYLSADTNTGSVLAFSDGDIITSDDGEAIVATVGASNATGRGSASHIDAGIYFVNGMFVIVDQQTVVIDKYASEPTGRIGLLVTESVVTPEDDQTLTDNAQGSPNYAAPGAHRFKINLILIFVLDGETVSKDFIELQRLENGNILNEIRVTEYSELERTFARRTYDESGDYTVVPFNLSIKEFYKDITDDKYKDGKYDDTAIAAMDPVVLEAEAKELIAIGVEPGKAYVRGHERNPQSTVWIRSNKSRETATVTNSSVNFGMGHYIYVKNMFKVPNLKTFPKLNLYDAAATDDGTSGSGNLIGTCRVRAVRAESMDSGIDFSESIFRLYIFDVQLNVDKVWSQVLWIAASTAADFTCKTDLTGISFYDGLDLQIIDPSRRKLLFPLPNSYIETLGGVGSVTTYSVQRTFPTTAAVAGTLSIPAGSDGTFDSFTGLNYILMHLDGATGADASDDTFIKLTEGGNLTLTDDDFIVTGLNLTDSYILLAPVTVTTALSRTKSGIGGEDFISDPSRDPNGSTDLDYADVNTISSVIDSGDPGLPVGLGGIDVTITDRYYLDTGQRDSYYSLGKIVLKPGATPPVGQIKVLYSYYQHGTTNDYFCVDSYPVDDVTYFYEDIPSYVSESGTDFLSDVFDFRPTANSSGDFPNAPELPLINENIRSTYDHYLNRRDRLYLDFAGNFNLIEGIPAVVPAPPKSPDDGMILYNIFMEAYTSSPNMAKPVIQDNKRYTMKMIGDLDERIGNLEYYGSLSLLEQDTAQLQITDGNGLNRFKNGFIVEPFTSHEIGDSASSEYKASISPKEGLMRPTFSVASIDLDLTYDVDQVTNNHIQQTGALVTLPYTSTAFIDQPLATIHENVNPFAVRLYKGDVTFNPDSDNWHDTENNGELIVNNDAHFEALQFMANNAKGINGVTWDSWQTQWSSSKTIAGPSETISRRDTGISHEEGWLQTVSSSVMTTTTTQKRTGTNTTNYATTIDKDMGDRTVGINYVPYMRSIPILIKVTKMKPNTRVYPFFDDVDVSSHCEAADKLTITNLTGDFNVGNYNEEIITAVGGAGGTYIVVLYDGNNILSVVNKTGDPADGDIITGADSSATATINGSPVEPSTFVTDSAGQIALVFTIPNSDTLKFRTGERVFKLSDQVNG